MSDAIRWAWRPQEGHIEGDGPTVFAHACKLGLEGVVSKRTPPTVPAARPTGSR
jgi:ATP-dependent DNA ligase